MANSTLIASALVFLVMVTTTAFEDSNICEDTTTCGKGKCQAKPEYVPRGYVCECDAGWRRTRLPDSEEQYLQFLPCSIPNCSINYSCMAAPPPLPPVPTKADNVSVFNPCYWVYCGEGTCSSSSEHMHECRCQPGAYNLLNISHFPCYSDCAVGSDCSKLGIKVSQASLTAVSGSDSKPTIITTSNSTSDTENHATPVNFSWKLNWIIIGMMSLVVFLG